LQRHLSDGGSALAYTCRADSPPVVRRGKRAMIGLNELVLVGTGFVLARVVYLFYFAPKKGTESERG